MRLQFYLKLHITYRNIFYLTDKLEHTQSIECLMVMIFSPYTPYLIKYRALEEEWLNKELDNIKMVKFNPFPNKPLFYESAKEFF